MRVGEILENSFNTKISTVEELKAFLKEYFETDEVDLFLFGSRARGDDNKFSDVDLGIYKKKDVDLKISLLREILENSNLPFKVDIVVLNNNEKFRDVVSKEGVRWI
ncbi:nucleotidyltransferase domain-containing protein [Hippea sp. KM1]|uniref:nucleotidyltransferase domain-containing protein n=1 Tax=Hippea sp. KM1 TaxID=944481 RepID=UPI00046D5D6E|nr:nucleotidyltransferase domain-containing protein [Hippea sp. KM1]